MADRPRRRKRLNKRGLTSFILTGAFLILLVSGVMLYVAPRGRIAHWTGWTLLGLDKDAWAAAHSGIAVAFLVAVGFHLYFNWTAFSGYFKVPLEWKFGLKREFAIALVVLALLAAGAAMEWPPFNWLMQGRDAMRDYWERPAAAPPVAHAEEWTLARTAQSLGMGLDTARDRLEAAGIDAAATDTLADLAERGGTTPQALYELLGGEPLPDVRGGGGQGRGEEGAGGMRGYGRMTVSDVAADAGITDAQALDRLRAAGIEADTTDRLRDIAARAGLRPGEVASVVTGDEHAE